MLRQTIVCRGTSTLTLRIEPYRQETARSLHSSLYTLAYKLFITKKDGLYHNIVAIASLPAIQLFYVVKHEQKQEYIAITAFGVKSLGILMQKNSKHCRINQLFLTDSSWRSIPDEIIFDYFTNQPYRDYFTNQPYRVIPDGIHLADYSYRNLASAAFLTKAI